MKIHYIFSLVYVPFNSRRIKEKATFLLDNSGPVMRGLEGLCKLGDKNMKAVWWGLLWKYFCLFQLNATYLGEDQEREEWSENHGTLERDWKGNNYNTTKLFFRKCASYKLTGSYELNTVEYLCLRLFCSTGLSGTKDPLLPICRFFLIFASKCLWKSKMLTRLFFFLSPS